MNPVLNRTRREECQWPNLPTCPITTAKTKFRRFIFPSTQTFVLVLGDHPGHLSNMKQPLFCNNRWHLLYGYERWSAGRPGWHRLITRVWSPLYPVSLGVSRRIFAPTPEQEMTFDHLVNIPIFLLASVHSSSCCALSRVSSLPRNRADDVTAPGWHRVGKSHYWIYPVQLRGM
jgi:hypothetical protein